MVVIEAAKGNMTHASTQRQSGPAFELPPNPMAKWESATTGLIADRVDPAAFELQPNSPKSPIRFIIVLHQ